MSVLDSATHAITVVYAVKNNLWEETCGKDRFVVALGLMRNARNLLGNVIFSWRT